MDEHNGSHADKLLLLYAVSCLLTTKDKTLSDNGNDYDSQLGRKSSSYGLMMKRNQKMNIIKFQMNIQHLVYRKN